MSFVDSLLAVLLPARCSLCGDVAHRDGICSGCRADLPWVSAQCRACGVVLPPGAFVCIRCLRPGTAPPRVFAPLLYAYPVDRLVANAKFHGQLKDARLLGVLLGEAVAGALACARVERPDLLVPVPLHPQRLGRRGYNQALEIARPVARRLAIALDPGACIRVRATREQAGLPAAARRRNVRTAFRAQAVVRGARIAIIDDVITTGSTVAAMESALRRAGAAGTQAWIVAQTPLYRKV